MLCQLKYYQYWVELCFWYFLKIQLVEDLEDPGGQYYECPGAETALGRSRCPSWHLAQLSSDLSGCSRVCVVIRGLTPVSAVTSPLCLAVISQCLAAPRARSSCIGCSCCRDEFIQSGSECQDSSCKWVLILGFHQKILNVLFFDKSL